MNEKWRNSRENQFQPTFKDLEIQTRTGRAFTISGEGRHRKIGYRHGVACRLGDIELTEWQRMMHDLIHRSGEDERYAHLLTWLKEHNYCSESTGALEHKALELHSMRIFENEAWVDYLKFNQRFRPQSLDEIAVAYVRCKCCNEIFMTTQALLAKSHNGITNCQICGSWSEFEVLGTDTYTALFLPEEMEE